jgi:hypothetical protein
MFSSQTKIFLSISTAKILKHASFQTLISFSVATFCYQTENITICVSRGNRPMEISTFT